MLFFVTDGSIGKIIQCSRKNIYHMTSLHTLWNGVEKNDRMNVSRPTLFNNRFIIYLLLFINLFINR